MKKRKLGQRLDGFKKQAQQQVSDVRKNLDSKILNFTHSGVEQVKVRWTQTAQKLDLDEDIPVTLVNRILEKAKNIRESLQADEVLVKTKEKKDLLQKQVIARAQQAKDKTRKSVIRVKSHVGAVRKKSTTQP